MPQREATDLLRQEGLAVTVEFISDNTVDAYTVVRCDPEPGTQLTAGQLVRLVVVRLVINYGSNVLLGSVWKAMLYGKGYYYYFTTGLVKNTTMLRIEVLLMVLMFQLALPALARSGLLPKEVAVQKRLAWF